MKIHIFFRHAGIAARLSSLTARVACALLFAAMAMVGSARALDWPTRQVSIVVPYAPGGGTDIMARFIAQKLTEKYGKPFIVENKGGASGTIGAMYVANAAPDGYTFLFVGAVPTIIIPMIQKTSYNPDKDLTPISIFGTGNYILAVRASLGIKTLPELIAYAKEHPGKLNYASVGTGGLQHLGIALLAKRAGLNMVHIPYNGTMAAAALLTGDVDLYLGTSAEMVNAMNDKITLLASGSTKRLPQFPNLPTIGETLPNFRVAGWNGLFAPAGTPKAVIDTLVKDIGDIARDPEMAKKLTALGIEPVGSTPEQFADVIRAEQKNYREAVIAAGLLKN
jgi:tripartite-type tricarboxylate transporter receptor subunit TctC